MPRDPQHEETSAEALFKRLRETSEEDLPSIPDVPEMFPTAQVQGATPSQEVQAVEAGLREEKSEAVPADMARVVELLEELVAGLSTVQDAIEALTGGE